MMRPIRRGRKTESLALLAIFAGVSACGAPQAHRQPTDRPVEIAGDRYVTSGTCRACHPSQYASWHASYHRTMTRSTAGDLAGGRAALDSAPRGDHASAGTGGLLRNGKLERHLCRLSHDARHTGLRHAVRLATDCDAEREYHGGGVRRRLRG